MTTIEDKVRKIHVNNFLDLNVFSTDKDPSKLYAETIFVVPYSTDTGEPRINVTYSSILPFAVIDKNHDFGDWTSHTFLSLKDFPELSEEDGQRQVEGYLSLLMLTNNVHTQDIADHPYHKLIRPPIEEKRPVSVISVKNDSYLPMNLVGRPSLEAYAQEYMNENYRTFLPEREKAVAATRKRCYTFSLGSLIRIVRNEVQGSGYGVPTSLLLEHFEQNFSGKKLKMYNN